jgi:DNA-binding transcriptional regulator YdaS (Cro superfamily)
MVVANKLGIAMSTHEPVELSPIQQACAALGWGGQSKLARELTRIGSPCTPQAIQKMCSTGHVPAERVLDIEKITGVSRHKLRPDLYPQEISEVA